MSCCPAPCHENNALTWLICSNPHHVVSSIKVLAEATQERKFSIAEMILQDSRSDQCLKALIQFFTSSDVWLCIAVVNIFGMLLENEYMVQKLQEWNMGEANLCSVLGHLLSNQESDVVLNAAGALTSLVETPTGRQWLLQDQAVFTDVFERITCLLSHKRESMVNSAALILARLSLSELACQKFVSHSSALGITRHLILCLNCDCTDTAMNAAFTIGSLCGSEQGRSLVLTEAKEQRLVSSLQSLMTTGEGAQTACFTLSCLASNDDGHTLVMKSPSFPDLLDHLLRLLQSGDPENAWFAAMTVRVLVSRPSGVKRVRAHCSLVGQLKHLSCSPSTSSELQEELGACLKKLSHLAKPAPVTLRYQSAACIASWERLDTESGLEVTYSLFDEDTKLYCGPQCQITLSHSDFQHKQSLSLQLNISTSAEDVSPFSDPVEMRVARLGLKVGPPQNLHVVRFTATKVLLSWTEPEGGVKPISYQVYCDNVLVKSTRKLGTTVSSLSPNTKYTLSVCALGPRDTVSSCCSIIVQTADGQDHAPQGLTVVVLGCHELHIRWSVPAVPRGHLFTYELLLNECVVYQGTACKHTARHLNANTAYTCTVAAVTSKGSFRSWPVTKRTAKKEYSKTNRLTYSPKHKHLALPPISEVKTKSKKSFSPFRQPPEVQLTSCPDSGFSSRKNKHRLPPLSLKSNSPRNNIFQKTVSPGTQLDLNKPWNSAEIKSNGNDSPVNSESTTQTQHQSPDLIPNSPKISRATLLQWEADRRAADKIRPSRISQQITGNVRPLQPVSYNWSDLEQTKDYQNTHRNRCKMGSRMHNPQLKGRHYITTN